MKIKRLVAFLLVGCLCIPSFISASAKTVPMKLKELDISYLTFVFDDNTDSLKTFYNIITLEYGYPICAAVPSNTLSKNTSLLHNIENRGGEILSHTKTHRVLNRSVSWDVIEEELRDSYSALKNEGFSVNGIILAGGGGSEATDLAFRTEIEEITSKYYLYSDLYGASTQYYKPRVYLRSLINNSPTVAIGSVQQLAASPDWQVWFAHNTSELNETTLRAMLDEVKKQEAAGKLEVVTYRTMYSEHASWEEKVNFGPTKYTVDFYSTDNKTLLSSVAVESGKTATAPEIDLAEGVKFKGWSGPITNITKNCSVYAICEGVKTTDDPAVGLKHEHVFFEGDTTQTCGLCGLVTALKKPNDTSSSLSAESSSNDSLSTESSSNESNTASNISSKPSPEESAPSSNTSSENTAPSLSKTERTVTLIIIISATLVTIIIAAICC